MSFDLTETIAAIATAPAPGLRGIVRISGNAAIGCLADFRPAGGTPLAEVTTPTALPGALHLPNQQTALPATVYLWPGKRSYTHQPLAEIHTFGSPPLLQSVLRAVLARGARLAEPGEFTLRAFLAGRIDLPQAEAVLGVIESRGQRELQVALDQLAGGVTAPLARLREELLDLLAHLEAGLDFVEEDIAFISASELYANLQAAQQTVAHLAEQMTSRTAANERLRIVLHGAPNVGKSSLFNALASAARAIVSPQAGTTRDYLTADDELSSPLCSGGTRDAPSPTTARPGQASLPCQWIDTAGMEEEPRQGIAASAQQYATAQRQSAHLRLLCLDSSRPLTAWEAAAASAADASCIIVWTKTDLPPWAGYTDRLPFEGIQTSAASGAGIAEVRALVAQRLAELASHDLPVVATTAVRCRESLRLAADTLAEACRLAEANGGHELVAAELRTALTEIGKVVGAVFTDDILDRIFSRFCIGK